LDWKKKLEETRDIGDIFELVKDSVRRTTRRGRAGLSLVLIDIPQPMGGAHQMGSNSIMLNRNILERKERESPEYYKSYVFYVLLHEYLHSLGFAEEKLVRDLCLSISMELFGEESRTVEIASNPERFLATGYHAKEELEVPYEVVRDFDRSSTDHIYA